MDMYTPSILKAVVILLSLAYIHTARTTDCSFYPKRPEAAYSGCLSPSCLQTFQGLIFPSTCVCSSKTCDEESQTTKSIEGRQAPLPFPLPENGFQLIRDMQIMMNADLNECLSGISECNQICTNTFGSYKCECWNGFSLSRDGKTCVDINECITGGHTCTSGCINLVGSYRCSCPSPAFQLAPDGITCIDVNECITGQHTCNGQGQACANTYGSYRCLCPSGFAQSRDGTTCQDVNECLTNLHGCQQDCLNTIGSFRCGCSREFKLLADGRSCAPASITENNNMV